MEKTQEQRRSEKQMISTGVDEDRRIALSSLILSSPKVPDISLHRKQVLLPNQAEY